MLVVCDFVYNIFDNSSHFYKSSRIRPIFLKKLKIPEGKSLTIVELNN